MFMRQPDTKKWQKWELEDTGRAEFPLDKATDAETYASGMALDLSSQHNIVISKSVG